MNKNTRIASRNYVGGATAAMSRATAQSNLFGQKNSAAQPIVTRSQTSMLQAEQKNVLNQPSGELRSTLKQQHAVAKPVSKKGTKLKLSQ